MGTSWTNDQMIRELTRKGFTRQKRGRDHIWLALEVEGEPTSIMTKVSHSSKRTISRSILHKMSLELHMPSYNHFIRFLTGEWSREEYVVHLRSKGKLLQLDENT